uniref:Uncharacterized protein n=1 Tax=Ditylenchus dipsaci TaxID=166011 RepID=A0A915DCB7_9BILA
MLQSAFLQSPHPQWCKGRPSGSNVALHSSSSSFSYPSRANSKRNSSSAFIINYGFASAGYHFRGRVKEVIDIHLRPLPTINFDAVLDVPEDTQTQQHMAVFFIRYSDHRILPIYCHQPIGSQADEFIESLSDKHKDCIKKYLEKEKPDDGEAYLWIREDATMKTTVLSLKALENHFKNSERVRRVKWRHLSSDRISIYRYSLPIISTKFRLRVAHFLSRNYRCCIVLSVVFGHIKSTGNMTVSSTSSLFAVQQQGRGGGHPPPPATFMLKAAAAGASTR